MRLVGIALTAFMVPLVAVAEALKLEIKDAHADGQGLIDVEMTDKSARDFFEFTKTNLNKAVIFRIDGREISRPVIRSPIPGGRGLFRDMNRSIEEAIALAERLKSGKADLEVEAVGN
jgi:preprotein translocase subunit SecD